MQKMFESIKFVKIDRQAMVNKWKGLLKGKKLEYKRENVATTTPPGAPPGMPGMYYGGGEVQQDFDLCSDGTLMRKSASVGQVTGQNMMVYGSGMNQQRGSWNVTVMNDEPFLVVREGAEQGFKLEQDGKNLLLNGKPYTITASDQCK
jgi:hypothetical protein